MAKANEAGKKSLYRPRKRWFLWFVEWFFENKLLLLGFGHMLIFYNTPSFFDSLLSKSVRVTGRCCTCRLIDFDSVCRTSCSWMIQTLYATQAKLLCYGDNNIIRMRWLQSGPLPAISRVTRRVITPQQKGPHNPLIHLLIYPLVTWPRDHETMREVSIFQAWKELSFCT